MNIVENLKQRLSNPFVRDIGWLGTAQMVMRIFRLATTVVLARVFSAHDYGLIAIIYTLNGFSEVFTLGTLGGGIGAKIVETDERDLSVICDTAYWVNWMMCILVFLVQYLLSGPIAWFYHDEQLALPICALGLRYLIYPFFKVHLGLIQRENRLKIAALSRASEEILASLITVSLALIGLGVWAVVWALVFAPSVYLIFCYLNHSWRPPKALTFKKWQDIVVFGSSMLGIELMDKLRLNLHYLILGRFLSLEALGLFFFAFNAGIGISKQILDAVVLALFPHLCSVREDLMQLRVTYFSHLKTIAFIVIPLVLLQSSLAPIYVPIVFGQKWVTAVPILVIICLSAIPLAFALASYQLLNAVGKIRITLKWNLIYTVIFAVVLLIAVRWGILSVAGAILFCQGLSMLFSFWATRYVFAKTYV